MTPIKRFLALFCALALAMLACGITVDLGTPQPFSQDKVSSMVAQTLQAFTQEALSATPVNTPLATATATPTATPTNTSVPPTLSVSVATNCYAGPNTNYGFVITIYPGTTATVVGKDAADNYWIIDVPNYPGTLCWLSGQYTSVSGDTSNLSAPATPAISIYTLSEPRNLRVACTSQSFSGTPGPRWHNVSQWTVVFRWTNTDADQTGVRVYRNGWRVATLGRHATSYTDTFFLDWHHDWHHDVTYGVQAFNSTAVSSIVTINVGHCE